jgi:phosphatidylserine decarboxylase
MLRGTLAKILQQEHLNFLLTNRVPRLLLTRLMGWFSRIEQPWLCACSIAVWRLFTDLDLREAKQTRFRSLHECFTRELKAGARPIDPDPGVLSSPCDAIVGACGVVTDGLVLQAKGSCYRLAELLEDPDLARQYAHGSYVTLRLRAAMYHRFHAPYDCRVEQVTYVPGDVWNVNPAALRRIERLYCRNERAIIRCRLAPGAALLTLVPVAAILVASIRLHFLDLLLQLRYRGPHVIRCDCVLGKGEEMGWFEHGSTIIVFAPAGFQFADGLGEGANVRMGQALLRLPAAGPSANAAERAKGAQQA